MLLARSAAMAVVNLFIDHLWPYPYSGYSCLYLGLPGSFGSKRSLLDHRNLSHIPSSRLDKFSVAGKALMALRSASLMECDAKQS